MIMTDGPTPSTTHTRKKQEKIRQEAPLALHIFVEAQPADDTGVSKSSKRVKKCHDGVVEAKQETRYSSCSADKNQ